jgi:2-polyprenyl-3-methyl-5-hydroxy-6-metoxy-1,4-benzoquinol methylase
MPNLSQSVREGHYAKKQILCKDWLISWSHRSRFQIGLQLAQQFVAGRVLDYGCGDGSFLAMLMDSPTHPSVAVGVEIHPDLVEDCRARLGGYSGLSFLLKEELEVPEYQSTFDAVICMEVLEHVVEVEPMIDKLARLLTLKGKLLISVPVETGIPLLVKQTARRIAGWRGIGDYPGTSPYTLRELVSAIFANGQQQHIVRPIHKGADGQTFHDHKGFNWMVLRQMLTRKFHLEKVLASPLDWLTPHLASQVWFILRKA